MPAPLVFAAGQQFGYLEVIRFDSEKSAASGTRHWLCRCRAPGCSRKTSVAATYLNSGHTRSCGCLVKEHARKMGSAPHPGRPPLDLAGRKFGMITVTGFDGEKSAGTPRGKRLRFWKGKCDCGRPVSVRTNYLTSGHTTSCGKCVRYTRAARNLPTVAQRLAAWKAAEEIDHPDEGRCFAPGRAARYLRKARVLLDKSTNTIRKLANAGKLRTVLAEAAMNRQDIGYFVKGGGDGLDAFIAASKHKPRDRIKALEDGAVAGAFLAAGSQHPPAIAGGAAGLVAIDPVPATTPQPRVKKKRGRRVGYQPERALARRNRVIEAARSGEYNSVSALARGIGVDRSHASKILTAAGLTASGLGV